MTDLGGLARKRQLVALGARDRDLTNAVRSGEVIRARNGWYSTMDESDPRLRAVRVGGRLTGASALHELGAWMRHVPVLHVSLPRNSARLRSQWNRRSALTRARKFGAVVHWDAPAIARRGTRTSVDLADALVAYLSDAVFEEAVAALDWALRTEAIGMIELEDVVGRLPARLHRILDWVDARCDSYPESISRTRLRMRGFRIESQVPVGWGKQIDLVIQDHIGLEIDGRAYHADRFERDRAKDLDITLERRHALRITPVLMELRWDDILSAISIALEARGVAPPRRPRPRRPEADNSTRTKMIGRQGLFRLPLLA